MYNIKQLSFVYFVIRNDFITELVAIQLQFSIELLVVRFW